MNRQPSIASTAPAMGPCAFVRAAMSMGGQRVGYRHALHRPTFLRNRKDEDQVHPGEGNA